MKRIIFIAFLLVSFRVESKPNGVDSRQTNKPFFQLIVYHLNSEAQIKATDKFLENNYLPALHRIGIKNIGVFKPITNDTASDKRIYVLISFSSPSQWFSISDKIISDLSLDTTAKDFLSAESKTPPFARMESILLDAFSQQPFLHLPKQKNPERIFELRSYESPTFHLAKKKIDMFNKDEVKIFNRLGFNPVFYGKVVSGNRMPNLMYMPVFKNVADRNAQWKVFGSDSKWKEISTDPENENNVSVNHIDSILMQSTSYSDY